MEASEGAQNELVDDSKQMRGQKVQGKVKHEKTTVGKNIPSVLVKKKKDEKVVASNGLVAPKVQPVKSPKRKPLNGREAHITKHGKTDSTPAEGTRKSLNFKATPVPTFYQEPQLPRTELKKIPTRRPKSPRLGRKKTDSGADSEEAITIQTLRFGRLSLDEKAPKDNPVVKGCVPAETKKLPVRKSLPRLPSEKKNLSNGKVAPAKAVTASTKAKPGRKKPDKDVDALNQSSPVCNNAEPQDSQEPALKVKEDRTETHMVVEVVAVEP